MHFRSPCTALMLTWLLGLALLGPVPLFGQDAPNSPEKPATIPGRHEFTIEAAGQTWHYHVQVPKSYCSEKPTPVVLVLHGAGGSGNSYLDGAGWGAKADKEGFLAVAPDGLPSRPKESANFLLNPRLWNSGQLNAFSPRARVDDIAFFRALLDDVEKRWNVDRRRVYVTGHSNGSGMTFRLGAELSERFAAIAPVASPCWVANPKPKRGLPTLFILGMEDKLVPYAGGESVLPWGKRTTPPVMPTLERWARAIGCPDHPEESHPRDGLKVLTYPPGHDGATFTAYFIDGQGHNWPGGKTVLPTSMVGPSVDTLNATDVIWEFFQKHPRAE